MIEIITGDLLDAKNKYIGHQTNCLSMGKAAGIARSIFDKYQYADCYLNRDKESIPGTIDIRGDGVENRFIINLNSQYYPGASNFPTSKKDGLLAREKFFHQCLLKIAKIKDLESIAFPYRIGCGIAGGNWDHYLKTLNNFSDFVDLKQGAKVFLYRRECDDEF